MADLQLPTQPPRYDQRFEQQRTASLEEADRHNVKIWDVAEWPFDAKGLLTDPDGGKWRLVVDNTGALSTEAP